MSCGYSVTRTLSVGTTVATVESIAVPADTMTANLNVNSNDVSVFIQNTNQSPKNWNLAFLPSGDLLEFVYYFEPVLVPQKELTYGLPDGCLFPAFKTYYQTLQGASPSFPLEGVVDATETIYRYYLEETYGIKKCRSDASIVITDFVSAQGTPTPTRPTVQTRIQSNIYLTHKVSATDPNIAEPYSKLIQYEITQNQTLLSRFEVSEITQVYVVTGQRQLENSFVTQTTEVPVLVLYDPPGGDSYASIQRGTVLNFATTDFAQAETGFSAESEWGFGFQSTFPVTTELLFGQKASAGVDTGMSYTSGKGYSIELAQTIQTSDNPGMAGKPSDVIVGFSFLIEYGETLELKISSDNCQVFDEQTFTWTNNGPIADTAFFHSVWNIEKIQIPKLEQIIADSESDGDTETADEARIVLSNWQQILEDKENREIMMLEAKDNYGAGGKS
eukprot:Lithocolla_globosa_v1_NODE_76_length_6846_cov_31.756737.p2 type:complete len:446 gc:universal NODE_76_length_6846_cov_31.756737:6019-4682(-)